MTNKRISHLVALQVRTRYIILEFRKPRCAIRILWQIASHVSMVIPFLFCFPIKAEETVWYCVAQEHVRLSPYVNESKKKSH